MIFSLAKSELWPDTFWRDVWLVSPEIILAIGMCAVIIVPFFKRDSVKIPAGVAILTLLGALFASSLTTQGPDDSYPILFGMLVVDPFSQFFKILLFGFTLMVVAQWLIVRDPEANRLDIPDFMCLLLGATFGMSLMASASNMLTIFLAIEAASLPSFALAGFRKRTRIGTEGSLKYVIFGAVSSAIMLYGMSLIYGACGSLQLRDIAAYAADSGISPLMAVGLLGLFAGVGFKLSAVPLHFWCPDVFEGAPIEVTTFLSVASKGAAIVLLVRILESFGFAAHAAGDPSMFAGLASGIAIMGAVTATWGNLVAYHQNNIKRLLAYSSIAHAGYMMMAVAFLPIANPSVFDPASGLSEPQTIAAAILFYLLVYLFMNLGAFTVAAMIARQTGSEDIRDYADLRQRSPVLAVIMALCLLSLFGMPGLGGFMGKIFLATAMAKIGPGGIVLVAVLLVNTLISLFFYMRPIVIMYLKPDEKGRPSFEPAQGGVTLLLLCAFVLIVTGLVPSVAHDHVSEFKLTPPPKTIKLVPDAAPGTVDNDPDHAAKDIEPDARPDARKVSAKP